MWQWGGREIIHLWLKQFVTLLIIKWTETTPAGEKDTVIML